MNKNTQTTSVLKSLALATTLTGLLLGTGCTSSLSSNISSEGQVATSDLVFPELQQAWQKDGQFPNSENLSKIRPGVSKDDLYQLIGRPHFSEAQHAREWDYIFKFYQEDESIKVCQYKVIFDKDYIAQQFYWQPADCAKYAQIDKPSESAPVVVAPAVKEQINLAADTLFDFDQWQTEYMTANGRQSLNELAAVLRRYQNQGNSQVSVIGYTDHLGDDAYNLELSNQRAQTVRQYLISQGVDASTITAAGRGEANPLAQCSEVKGQALIDCLQPNRRVEVIVKVYDPQ
ncbi:OmpA family protein [Psychrobacter pygoscelis]|uniref:OmpA family protein n=1 Tax=Psychrobacter pygoscelis TaxID=2488563 RepID=UPI00103F1840|nr:OmpA family protein [Psychrobacter pygoscelis]